MKTRLLGKRILACLLVCILLFTMLPATVLVGATDTDDTVADNTVTGDGNTEEEIPDDPTIGDGTEEEPNDTPTEDTEVDLSGAISVATADELEKALTDGVFAIRLVADFELDRTFYITQDTYIFSEEAVILTRSATFGGDLFVVGEFADGTVCETAAVLSLGHPESTTPDLLTINGNSENMIVDVTGSVLYVITGSGADLYSNLTVTNAYKNSNERTLTAETAVSYPPRVGGAVAILTSKSSMNIYGGTYSNNRTNDLSEGETNDVVLHSAQGGAFYNYGTLNIYGGTFTGNHAARGGFLFNYRTARIYNALIHGNTASNIGGAVYMPNSTAARLYLGGENALVESNVIFDGNTSADNGGAIYARNLLSVENTTFQNNSAAGSTGGAIHAGSMTITIDNAQFINNTAKTNGGAIYQSGSNNKDDTLDLTITNTTFESNTAGTNGGAMYLSTDTSAYAATSQFVQNTADNGGAIYLTAAHLDADGAQFLGNTVSAAGGALAVCENASVKMNMVTATENAASKGGFAYINTAEFNLYNSTVNQNKTTKNGGAVLMDSGAFGGIYATAFEKNVSTGGNGGAVFVYTAGGEVTVHSCSFVENSGVSGGALYASSKSILHLYNNSANNNTAVKGGFLYHTTTGTTVDLVSITLSGNSATDGGPIIWGNSTGAVLNIDKGKYYDLDYTGDWDDTYWTAAIYNSLKVKEVTKDVPKYIDYDGTEITPKLPEIPTDVASSAELEKILESGKSFIHITADFELDRTFYIPYNLTIYSSEAHTLTRAPDFGGDIFVVGQKENGDKATATLTLGNKDSAAENLLIIDGNKDNMTVDVVGSVLFVVTGSGAELYPNLTVRNAYKNGNERTIATPYGMSYPPRIGGAMLIMSNKSTVNIYGGNYTDNRSNDASEGENDDEKLYSAQGGAIYNFGTLSIYGGTFENNHAARGGFLFSYRTANIYNAQILNNTADLGGAVYMPNSTGARMYLGGVNDLVESNVLFEGNTSSSYGGAIYARNLLSVENTVFKNNASTGASGGALYTNDMVVTVDNSHFIGNAAKSYGGAIYNTVNNGKDGYDVTIRNSEFSQNQATSHGGAIYSSSGARLSVTYSMFTENTSEASGGAVYVTGGGLLDASVVTFHKNTATTNGGALVFTATAPTMATGVLNRITATENTAKNGGFLYAGSSDVRLYNSTLQSNSSTSNGGAVAMYDGASGGIYSTTFDQNASGANGGALFLYTNTGEIIVHSCAFTGNEGNYGGAAYASNKSVATFYNTTTTDNAAIKGGAFYFTTTGTTVTIVGWTTSGNTATEGGPIIWGNSTGAKLYIDKKQYTDKDHTGTYDSAYWSAAIYNKLKVYDFSGEIPKYLDYKEESYDHMADAVDVSNADQLEMAINSGAPYIRVIADFALDRTFYIPGQTVIFSTLPHTLTRAPEFGGDIFVVGETAEGISALLLGKNASLTLGNPLSVQENLLTIDGNKDNMIVPVVGTVVFMFYGSNVDIHPNITVKNCAKAGSERTCNERYNFKYQTRTGGAFAIIGNGVMNIYGGIFKNNAVNHEDTSLGDEGRVSTYGGLIFNSGNLRIYDGLFENNCGARGAVVYNYRSLKVYGGRFINNTATVSGGAFYTPNVAVGNNFIGTSVDGGSQVLFQGNSSANQGGALYTGPLSTLVIYGNTSFVENQSTGSHGGAIAAYGQFTARDTLFQTNSAKKYGGAVYNANSNNNYVTRFTLLENCTFENNIARQGGALMLYASDADFDNGALVTVVDCTFTGNQAAAPGSTTTASYGGAIYMERKSELTLIGSEFKQNIARTEGGAIYAGGESVLDINDCSFLENSVSKTGKYGGGIAIHSVYLTVNNTTFDTNTAPSNGAALYVSYSSSREVNSTVKITESAFTDNSTPSYGGAIYVTRQDVSLPKRILDVRNTSFVNNSSKAGCVYLLPSVTAYMADVTFQNNTSLEEAGGAITATGSTLEMDTATFTGNTSAGSGGAIAMTKSAAVTLNAITAQNNTATNTGGFLYSNGSTLKMYDSTIQNNTSTGNGGGLALYDGAVASIYHTTIQNNTAAEGNGGGVFAYTGGTKVILHTCSVLGNSANFGGGIYASNASVMDIYKITATDNTAKKGGFLYETTTGTTILLVGAAVGNNTAAEGGPIIWGNSKGAVLNLNKSLFVDNDTTGSLDDAYWATAIVNALTVNTIATTTPGYTKYTGTKDPGTTPTVTIKDPVPVQEIFDLAQKPTSDADIDSYYAKFPRLDNSSNFMSKNATTFENINGGTVTVDTFVYPTNGKADNCTVGEGLLIYQAMLYKQAHPEEEVHIDISSYRFSVQASVNINRNSRYFGYMRQLSGVEYDQYGFVRVAYLLVSAAKMGIHVNVIGHIDGYPKTEDFITYFNTRMSYGCDPAYAAGGAVGDYLKFYPVEWDLGEKGGTDMMHTKLCAVSHYLDMYGVEHQNAIWTSSSNLDGINKSGTNANWKLQTGTIVSDHADLYRVSVNYLRSMLPYMGQEQIYEWQDLINTANTTQTKLIAEGRGNEIDPNEQIVYLGSETDPVFELYFTPLGGGAVTWDELNSPYCKYLRKLYDSEDYILFSWNAAEYSGKFALGQDMEKMIVEAFHQNRNPQNKIYANMESFDPTTFDDLKIGTDIGYVSINKWERGQIHNKDLMFSYVENGQRYYVTLHNSTNMHSGSMCYQSNFALVIKETTCAEDSVFSTFAQNTTTQDFVEHTYGEEQTYTPANTSEDGYTYRECTVCAHQMKTGIVHQDGEWVVDREPTAEQNGIRHKNCPVCGERTHTQELTFATEQQVSVGNMTGKTFTSEKDSLVSLSVNEVPRTWEAVIELPRSYSTRGGVIVGNYAAPGAQINLEIHYSGRPRLFYINEQGERADILFNTDIRSNKPTHLAVTVDEQNAILYVNGVATETAPLPVAYPNTIADLKIGGDNRTSYQPIFGGRIYSVSLFNDVRTAAEIERDLILVTDDADSSLLCNIFLHEEDSYTPTSAQPTGKVFAETEPDRIPTVFTGAPMTWEATLQLSPSVNGYGGAIVSNIGIAGQDQIGWEITENGNPKLVFITKDGTRSECVFETDIRSDVPLHVAITLSAKTATLYINAQAAETQTLPKPIPTATTGFCIGGDHQSQNPNAFQGVLYSVNIFQDVRTQTEIASDLLVVTENTAGLQYSAYYTVAKAMAAGQTFTADTAIPVSLEQAPHTLEAVIHLPKHHTGRGGVILGNYSGKTEPQIKLEIMEDGHPRVFVREKYNASVALFSADVRSDSPVHLAVTLTGTTVSLYVNGVHTQTRTLSMPIPEAYDNFLLGGDHTAGNVQYFKGILYSAALFADVRTAEEIQADTLAIPSDADALLYSATFPADANGQTSLNGQTFNGESVNKLPAPLSGAPHTIEAIVHLPKTFTQRGGVLFGNYTGSQNDQMNFEIYTNGLPRLWYKVNGVTYTHLFTTNICSDSPVQLALSYNDEEAYLFVNGVLRETVSLACPLPDVRADFCIGGDNRVGNTQFFKGTLYALNVFSDTRSEEQIRQDGICVPTDDANLLYAKTFNTVENKMPGAQEGKTFDAYTRLPIDSSLTDSPKTIEAIVSLPTDFDDRGGIIVGNYDGTSPNQLNLEVAQNGQLRLFFTNNGTRISHLFNTDIRSDMPVHLAVTLDGCDVTLYVNGAVTETVTLPTAAPYVTDNFCIGCDNRAWNLHYFKGTIYGVGLYNVVKTAEEIQKNAFSEVMDTNGLLYGTRFTKTCLCAENATGIHTESDWIVDFEPTDTAKGIKHIECTACHTTLTLAEIAPTGQTVDYTGNAGLTPTDKDLFTVDTLAGTPRTFEFSFILPKSYGSHLRGGVLFSNYNNGAQNQISIEIYTNGQARFWYKVNGVSYSALFAADVRSNSLTHLAFTVDGKNISLYVNGIYSETLTMGAAVPTDCTDNFCIGGDRRSANAQYFKGTIYSANVFDDVRTAEEIALDAVMVTGDTDSLLYSKYFSN